jgi:putative tricarboxylic transport membrane protein
VEIGVALCGLALGLFVLAGSFSIGLGAGYDRIGPRFFPYLIAAGALFSGALLLKEALGRGKPSRPPGDSRASRAGGSVAVTLGLALASGVLLLERAGFVLTAALLFWLVARAFASGSPLRDAAVGLALSVASYLAFTRGLGLALPGGLLGGLL